MNPVIEIKFVHPLAEKFSRATPGSAGFDLVACVDEPVSIRRGNPAILIPTGIKTNMADAHIAGIIVPRSGKGHKTGLVLGNGVGVVDSDYLKEWYVSAWNRGQVDEIIIQPGEAIAQALFMPVLIPVFKHVDVFSIESTERKGGFGSTGR